ncbi:MAG: VOC family protein [Chloroflexi bacterium]|nr:VOC family protein [Chloroflexota bacterium]
MKVKRLHHVCTVMQDVEKAAAFFQDVFGAEVLMKDTLPLEYEKSIFMRLGDIILELMEPTDPNMPIGKWLANHGESLFAIGVQVDNFEEAVKHFESKGVRVVGKQVEPVTYAFGHPKDTHGIMIEFGEYKRPKGKDPIELLDESIARVRAAGQL